MRGFGRGSRWWIGGLVPALVLLLGAASPAVALDGREEQAAEEKPAKECPNVVVITNIDVNVATWLKIRAAEDGPQHSAQNTPPPKTEPPKPANPQENSSLVDVFTALGKLPAVRDNVVVITNVKVNVATWLDLIGPPKKPHAGPQPEPKPKPNPKP